MLITRTSAFTGQQHTLDIDVTPEQLEEWRQGALIQRVMPNLTDGEREFIRSGVTPTEWDAMMGDGDDEYYGIEDIGEPW